MRYISRLISQALLRVLQTLLLILDYIAFSKPADKLQYENTIIFSFKFLELNGKTSHQHLSHELT